MCSGSFFIAVSRLFILCALLPGSCSAFSWFMTASCRRSRSRPATTPALSCCCFATLGARLIFTAAVFAMGAFCGVRGVCVGMLAGCGFGCAAGFITRGLLAIWRLTAGSCWWSSRTPALITLTRIPFSTAWPGCLCCSLKLLPESCFTSFAALKCRLN